jgi:hypothetical protein
MAMGSETAEVALELIRAIQADLDAIREDMREIKRCLTSIEASVADMTVLMRTFR